MLEFEEIVLCLKLFGVIIGCLFGFSELGFRGCLNGLKIAFNSFFTFLSV